ncbi:aminotransferase class V-fold PLP-dependent enzyme [Cellulomonas sp. C5510]|uniref:aminotransferase class V-fold PLP-dependent enzyme n=1 Tax=Cellulomonas sp. C5510 TaxID=2871170 RepID=UPI0021027B05|nr:aminotransferase class V-fold PLP-dependent enzyme [Cellulomonas sp. C5510]
MFSRRPEQTVVGAGGRYGFAYLPADNVYLDSACQTLRPQPVIDALNEYYLTYNACGERVAYEWGRKVDERVGQTRAAVLKALGLPARRYTTSFTLNTTYALNLLLQQLPAGRYRRVVTTHTEHNSVFLSTMTFARREGIERLLLDRDGSGALVYRDRDLAGALVVVSAMNNVDGAPTVGLAQLVADVRRAGGTTVIDAAQAVPHGLSTVRGLTPDALCFSAHKVYGASLGVVAASHELLGSLELSFVGGGQVAHVTASDFDLLPELHTRLEAGLQPWGEIIALGAALRWLDGYQDGTGERCEAREERLSQALVDGLTPLPGCTVLSPRGSSLVSVRPDRVDGHRLAAFLSRAGIMVRSGYFCAHHWLQELETHPPLVRFSLGAHNTDEDVERTLDVMDRLMKGL